jgi:hypothetical protein
MPHSASHSVDIGDCSTGVKWLKREIDHTPLSSVEVKNDIAECLRGMYRDRHIYFGAVGAPAVRTDGQARVAAGPNPML